MQLSDYIRREHIFTGFTAPDKPGAVAALCRLAAGVSGVDAQALLNVVMNREAMGSTGLGGGVALPHSHTDLVDTPLIIVAIASQWINFESLDKKPVRLFVLLLTPAKGDSREHLQLLARLGAMFKSNDTVEEFLSAQSPDEVFELILKRQ
jgi:PTS system nitrogen regulatory IIA component